MTLQDLLQSYLNKEVTAIHVIRTLTAMFDPEDAINLLVVVNQITRLEEGDMDVKDFQAMFGMEEMVVGQ